jgi:hypothetical protein
MLRRSKAANIAGQTGQTWSKPVKPSQTKSMKVFPEERASSPRIRHILEIRDFVLVCVHHLVTHEFHEFSCENGIQRRPKSHPIALLDVFRPRRPSTPFTYPFDGSPGFP